MSHFRVLVAVEPNRDLPEAAGVESAISEILIPYQSNPEDYRYMEFQAIDIQKEYHASGKDNIMTVKEFAEHYGYTYERKSRSYGYYHNPNAKLDAWAICGPMIADYLVRDDCAFSIADESINKSAPDGYRWVSGARKRDIQWQAMHDWKIAQFRNTFKSLEKWFIDGVEPDDKSALIFKTDEGINSVGGMLYFKGETFQAYLNRTGIRYKFVYPPYAFIDDLWNEMPIGWFGECTDIDGAAQWHEKVENFINSVPDDYYLGSIDCHI